MDEISEIKERLNIVEVVQSYLTLKKAGQNYKGLCPFHSEKTPSFMISPERQSFKCFGCGEGGDIFTFIEKMEGVDFYNALKILADKAGVKLKARSVTYGNKEYSPNKETRAYGINSLAARVYHKILTDHPKAEKARAYLKDRGLTDKTIGDFKIGYAPNSWDFLIKFLTSKNYTKEEIFAAGLIVRKDNGEYYDRFRGRITFPINNVMGNPVGFTARLLDDSGNPPAGGAKYVNSSESSIYHKSKIIYGLDAAKMAIKNADLAVVVEGNMDVIACHQGGYLNTVASSGTALTLDQMKILNRYASEIAFSFDRDNAGETALKRAVTIALSNDITAKVIDLDKKFKDPDEAIKNDKQNWQRAIDHARPALEVIIDRTLEETADLGVNEKKKIAKEILPLIKLTASDIEKEHYIKYLAKKLLISEHSLTSALNKAKAPEEFAAKGEKPANIAKKELTVYERLAGIVWAYPKLNDKIQAKEREKIKPEEEEANKTLVKILNEINTGQISKNKYNDEEANLLDQLSILALAEYEPVEEESLGAEVLFLIGRIDSEDKEKIKEEFARKIEEAEGKGDREAVKALVREFSDLIKNVDKLKEK